MIQWAIASLFPVACIISAHTENYFYTHHCSPSLTQLHKQRSTRAIIVKKIVYLLNFGQL